jgi:hypothetical protein
MILFSLERVRQGGSFDALTSLGGHYGAEYENFFVSHSGNS